MNIRIMATMLAVIVLVTWGRTTQAALSATEQAYELYAHMVESWPLGDEGHIILRPCEECDRVVLRVNAATRYSSSLAGQAMSRDQLLRLKAKLVGGRDAFVYVFYQPEEKIATRIILDADD